MQAATFLFHGVSFEGTGTQRVEEKFLREKLESIEADKRRLATLIASRTTITEQAAEQLFAQQATKDAAYAKANKIIDDIRDAQVPQGALYFHLNVQ